MPFLDLIYRLYRMALRNARWRHERRNADYRQEVFEHLLGDVIKAAKTVGTCSVHSDNRAKETLAYGHLDHADDRIEVAPT